MLGAIGRYFWAFVYLFTGRIDSARKELTKNPYLIQATFDRIIQDKTTRISQYKDAVATMITQQEKKLATIKNLGDEVNKLERLKEGAAAKAKTVVQKLKGRGTSQEAIKHDEEYMKCLGAYNDLSSTLHEKNARITELEVDVGQLGDNIAKYKVQLQQVLREIDKLKGEAAATVADMITAKEEESIANMIAGISADRFAKELEDMRDVRDQQKAKARVARDLAGIDTQRQEAEFVEYVRSGVATEEFDRLIGLAQQTDGAAAPEPTEKTKTQLPEL